jgi:hypothetical protein
MIWLAEVFRNPLRLNILKILQSVLLTSAITNIEDKTFSAGINGLVCCADLSSREAEAKPS